MFITFLLLGSNLGERTKYLHDASVLIESNVGMITARSSLYQTASWGKHDQPDFINQVLEVRTILSPRKLLENVLSIESELGRQRIEKWGSRTIDIDILLYANQIIDQPDLTIPHPYLHERRFCLLPLSEIAADLVHPIYIKPVSELLDELQDDLFVKKLP